MTHPRDPDPDDVARAVALITLRVQAEHARASRLWALSHGQPATDTCGCGCLLLYPAEPCPNCEVPMPRRAS